MGFSYEKRLGYSCCKYCSYSWAIFKVFYTFLFDQVLYFLRPRSKSTEIINGKEVLCFRGECINGYSLNERKPDPERMLKAYFHSSATLNYIRLLSSCRKEGLYTLLGSDYSFLRGDSSVKECFTGTKSLDFSDLDKINELNGNILFKNPSIFTSHEGLLLEYEECMTRKIKDLETNEAKWWNLGAHFLWIGDRTRDIDGAHVEYFRGIENPIGYWKNCKKIN